jgi:hypothetical protein
VPDTCLFTRRIALRLPWNAIGTLLPFMFAVAMQFGSGKPFAASATMRTSTKLSEGVSPDITGYILPYTSGPTK